jgi:hypothetical protein
MAIRLDWKSIARGLKGRDNKECRKRWLRIDRRWNRGAWTSEEDEYLKDAVGDRNPRYGAPENSSTRLSVFTMLTALLSMISWKAVSDRVGTRSPDRRSLWITET